MIGVDASERFLAKSKSRVTDPEEKRKIIGAEFIAVFADEARQKARPAPHPDHRLKYLVQGTSVSRT